jgi:hypothetical protein
MNLSILIPAVPNRFDKAVKLYNHLLEQIGERQIEVLLFCDNKKRTIGEKRNDLKNISKGKYFMFVDDDDWMEGLDKIYEATERDVDVITFNQSGRNSDGSNYKITFGLGNEVEHNNIDGIYTDLKRPPFHVCAWNSKFKEYNFPYINYAEDWGFISQVLPLAKTEYFIDEVLHFYNFDINITEADTSSNEFWKNPNHNEESNS